MALNVERQDLSVDKWTSSTTYKSAEIRLSWNRARVVAYQFDSTILRDVVASVSCIFPLSVEFDSNKEDVVSPVLPLGACKPFRGD